MKNKGFTLIELLAVIVILAIIALIATPVILGIINDSRDNAKERSAELVISTLKTSYASAYMLNNGQEPDLTQVKNKIKDELSNIDGEPTISGNALTIKTADGLECVFELDTTTGVLSLNKNGKCGKLSKSDAADITIGKLATSTATS